MNILEIVIIVITLLLVYRGFRKGFILRLASMLSLVISIMLVSALLPTITDVLKNNTPLYGMIEKQCRRVVAEKFVESYKEQSPENSKLLENAKSLGLGLDGNAEELLNRISLTKVQQQEIIDNLPFPERIRTMLQDYNNKEGYSSLNASSFQEYIVSYISTAILNVISYIVCILLVQILLWGIISALNVISHLPVIGTVNHLLGLALGLVEALFLLWLFFLILSMLTTTPFGLQLFNMVEESAFLSCLYEANLFVKLALSAAAIFM